MQNMSDLNSRYDQVQIGRLIAEIAGIVKGCLNKEDVLCRFNSHEIAALLSSRWMEAMPVAFAAA